jgi:hypothetical protein
MSTMCHNHSLQLPPWLERDFATHEQLQRQARAELLRVLGSTAAARERRQQLAAAVKPAAAR